MSACEETCVATVRSEGNGLDPAPVRCSRSPVQVRDPTECTASRLSVRSAEYTRNQRFGSAGHVTSVTDASLAFVRAMRHAWDAGWCVARPLVDHAPKAPV